MLKNGFNEKYRVYIIISPKCVLDTKLPLLSGPQCRRHLLERSLQSSLVSPGLCFDRFVPPELRMVFHRHGMKGRQRETGGGKKIEIFSIPCYSQQANATLGCKIRLLSSRRTLGNIIQQSRGDSAVMEMFN